MKLEQQVCSLELAKKLKELGVKQESYFEWAEESTGRFEAKIYKVSQPGEVKQYHHMHFNYSAFTVAELGEMLPSEFEHEFEGEKATVYLLCGRCVGKNGWNIFYEKYDEKVEFKKPIPVIYSMSETDARAKILIYLLENNLLNI